MSDNDRATGGEGGSSSWAWFVVVGFVVAWVSFAAGLWPGSIVGVLVIITGVYNAPAGMPISSRWSSVCLWMVVGLVVALVMYLLLPGGVSLRRTNDAPKCAQLARERIGNTAAFDMYVANDCWMEGGEVE